MNISLELDEDGEKWHAIAYNDDADMLISERAKDPLRAMTKLAQRLADSLPVDEPEPKLTIESVPGDVFDPGRIVPVEEPPI